MATPEQPQIQINPVASLNALSFYWGPPSTLGPEPIIGYQLICSSINFVQNFTSTASYAQVSSLTNTTDLVFQLAAKNINGTGPFTPFLSAEPGIASAGVGSVTASTVAFNQALVQWTYSTNVNEAKIAGFSLSVISPNASTLVFSMYPNQSSLTISNLTSPLNYNFRVLPVNEAGWAQSTTQSLSNPINFSSFGFNPSTIGNAIIWVDASTLTSTYTNGANVTSWPNRGDPTYSLIAPANIPTLTTSVLNSNAVVTFTTSQYLSVSPSFGTSFNAWSLFTVARQTSNNSRFFGGSNGNTLYRYWGGSKGVLYLNGDPGYLSQFTSDTNWDIMSIVLTKSVNVSMWWNGSQLYNVGTSQGSDNLQLNGYVGGNELSNGQMAEVLYFNKALTTNARLAIEGYLAWKWGLQAKLPISHTYYSAAPNGASPL